MLLKVIVVVVFQVHRSFVLGGSVSFARMNERTNGVNPFCCRLLLSFDVLELEREELVLAVLQGAIKRFR